MHTYMDHTLSTRDLKRMVLVTVIVRYEGLQFFTFVKDVTWAAMTYLVHVELSLEQVFTLIERSSF